MTTEPWLLLPHRTKEILERHDVRFRKKFGQNFLVDAHVVEGIIAAAKIEADDLVIEIGPGIGTLTQYLCANAGRVIAIEIDRFLLPVLEETLADYDNVEVVHGDVMKLDLAELSGGRPFKVVANLPYYITTPILMKLLEDGLPVTSITVMIQKEVAERMQAAPGTAEYGALSLAVQYYAKPRIAVQVPPNCFIPRPKVGSAVISLEQRAEDARVETKDVSLMFRLIRAAFAQRRKKLVNAIEGSQELSITKEAARDAILSMGLAEDIRGEKLSLAEFAALADQLSDT